MSCLNSGIFSLKSRHLRKFRPVTTKIANQLEPSETTRSQLETTRNHLKSNRNTRNYLQPTQHVPKLAFGSTILIFFSAVDFEHNLIVKKVKLVNDGENLVMITDHKGKS